jgi:hypothetical protein
MYVQYHLTFHVELRQTPVDHFQRVGVVVDHDVSRLKVLMHDAFLVRKSHGIKQFEHIESHILWRQLRVQVAVVSILHIFENENWIVRKRLLYHVLELDDVRVPAHALSNQYLPHHFLSLKFSKTIQLEDIRRIRRGVVPQVGFSIRTRPQSLRNEKIATIAAFAQNQSHRTLHRGNNQLSSKRRTCKIPQLAQNFVSTLKSLYPIRTAETSRKVYTPHRPTPSMSNQTKQEPTKQGIASYLVVKPTCTQHFVDGFTFNSGPVNVFFVTPMYRFARINYNRLHCSEDFSTTVQLLCRTDILEHRFTRYQESTHLAMRLTPP